MKCNSMIVDTKNQATFELRRDRNAVYLVAPDGTEYLLIFEQVLDALGLDIVKKLIYGEITGE